MFKYLLVSIALLVVIPQTEVQEQFLEDWEMAREQSAKENKPIFLVFAGIDWCAPCIRQESEIFETEEFRAYAKENLILMKAKFPRKRKNRLAEEVETQNKALAEQYNPNGYFPFNLLISVEGEVLGSCSYRAGGADPFIRLLNEWQEN